MADTSSPSGGFNPLGFLPVIGQIAQGFIDRNTAKQNIAQEQKGRMELAQYQYSKDLDIWNKANQYNSPEQQMLRYEKAGLNKNLIYGQQNMASGQLPKFQAPQYDYNPPSGVDLPNVLSQFQDFRLKQAQLNNLKVQNEIMINKEMMGRYDVQYAPDMKFQQLEALRNKNVANGWQRSWTEMGSLEGLTEYARAEASKLLRQSEKLRADTAYTDIQTDWYTGKAVSGMVGNLLGVASRYIPAFRKGKGSLSPGTMPNLGQQRTMKPVPPGVSPNIWFNRQGYGGGIR